MPYKFTCIAVNFDKTQPRYLYDITAVTAHSFHYWGIIKSRLNGNGMRNVYSYCSSPAITASSATASTVI